MATSSQLQKGGRGLQSWVTDHLAPISLAVAFLAFAAALIFPYLYIQNTYAGVTGTNEGTTPMSNATLPSFFIVKMRVGSSPFSISALIYRNNSGTDSVIASIDEKGPLPTLIGGNVASLQPDTVTNSIMDVMCNGLDSTHSISPSMPCPDTDALGISGLYNIPTPLPGFYYQTDFIRVQDVLDESYYRVDFSVNLANKNVLTRFNRYVVNSFDGTYTTSAISEANFNASSSMSDLSIVFPDWNDPTVTIANLSITSNAITDNSSSIITWAADFPRNSTNTQFKTAFGLAAIRITRQWQWWSASA